VPTNALAALPPAVTFAQAATLPVAGLTALFAVERHGSLLGRAALITGASGGVGLFACRLASLAGARVVGQVRRAEAEAVVRAAGARQVVVGESVAPAAASGPYDLIVDPVGGGALAEAVALLARWGTCVSVGASAGMVGMQVPLDLASVYRAGSVSLHVLSLFAELTREPASVGLERLARLVADGQLTPHVGVEEDWGELGRVAQDLIARRFSGKAVLHVQR